MKNIILPIVILILASCSGGRNNTGYSIINDMKYAIPYEAYTENPVLPNRQTMVVTPAGSVPRGFIPEKMGADGMPLVQENPFEMTEYAWERGEKYYKIMCSTCHGAEGKGDGPVVEQGGFPKPPSFNARRWRNIERYSVGHVYNVITHGIGNMASYSQQLYPEDRWAVAEYVRKRLMRGKNKFKQ